MARRLAFTTRGDGQRPVILLHGFLGSGRNLASLARRLCERDPSLSLVLPDLTGHGTSPPLPPAADLSTLAEDVLELVATLGLARPVALVGHSLGGRVGLLARHLDPGSVARVTLLDIAPGPIPSLRHGLEPVLAALVAAPAEAAGRAELRAHFAAHGVSPALTDWLLMNVVATGVGSLGWRIERHALELLHARTNPVDLWPTVEAARGPTRVIRGGASGFVSEADVTRLEALGVPVATLQGAGHFLHVDDLEGLLALLESEL